MRCCALLDAMLLQQAQVFKLETTNQADLKWLRGWLDDPDGGGLFLLSHEADTYEDTNPEEYVTLFSGFEEKDRFTLWFRDKFVRGLWHDRFAHRISVSLLI